MLPVNFVEANPSLENHWRSIILFGRNVASYKFALAKSLLELKNGQELIRLEELAVPFARQICQHLIESKKQATSSSSRFLEECTKFNQGEISESRLVDTTVRLGFNNVIDAFHNVNQGAIPVRFFSDERKAGGVRLTTDFFEMLESPQVKDLPDEVESRWRLVETAWALNLSRHVVSVGYDDNSEALFAVAGGRRKTITSCRGALSGYQKGKCFYCSVYISVLSGEPALADVDHFFPHVLSKLDLAFSSTIDGIWNLVLSCKECNRGVFGKSARIPDLRLLERLHVRNEYFVSSHHPLRETIIAQTGLTEPLRRNFLQNKYNLGRSTIIHTWYPNNNFDDRI